MKRYLLLFLFLLSLNVQGQNSKTADKGISRPKLIVGIVVDQMRWDYLYRYNDRYTDNGFKRMLREGFTCENTFINYLPSATAVGHSTIYTGSVPGIHGIAGNNWIDQLTGKSVYCAEDDAVETLGSSSKAGKMSPRNLLASTITDELKLATNFRSKVIGVSLKDRAAILPAGHAADGAFWFDDDSGNFISSTWYMNELPDWVKKFNAEKQPEKLTANGWNTLYPIDTYNQSTKDDVSWEGAFKGESKPVFPHDAAKLYQADHGAIRTTPFGNTLTLNLAKAAIDANKMGQGKSTDFLTINCASTDYVGHRFGPNSIEVEDTYLRLDRDLADFFSYLDKKIGKGQYLVFLSADHGAAHSFGFMAEHQIPADRLDVNKIIKELNQDLQARFNTESLIYSGMNYQMHFDKKKIRDNKLDFQAVKEAAVRFLQEQPGVQYAVDVENIGAAPVPEPIKTKIINGYNVKRSGPVIIIPEPGWFSGGKTGTSHGNWNPYDTHIPLVFMGWGIQHGSSAKVYNMTDIAPTIAAMLHIQMPNGAIGKPITEVVK